MIAHELLSHEEGATPFADMEHPRTCSDAVYQDGSISERCRSLGAGLLKVAPAERLDAAEGSRHAKKLLADIPAA